MSTFRNLFLVALAMVFAFGLVVIAVAGPLYNETNGSIFQLRQDYRDALRALHGPGSNISSLPAAHGARSAGNLNPAGMNPVFYPSAPCAVSSTQCPGFEEAGGVWNVPSGAGAGTRKAVATQVANSGVKPESVTTVTVLVLWDPADELGIGYFPTAGTPTVRVEVFANGGGLPTGAPLVSVSRTFADWSTDPGMGTFGGSTLVGYLDFDVSGAGIVIPPGGKVHSAVWIDQTTPNVDWLWLWSDDATAGGCPDLSSNYRSDAAAWLTTTANYGSPYNFVIYTTLCTEQPPPVCSFQMPHCDPNVYAGAVTIFSMPRTTRNAFANRFFAGQAGQAQPCTVKAVYPWIYDDNPADSADVVFEIREDDGGGLPGALVYSDSVAYASLVKDLSGPTVLAVPDVVVDGEFYISYRAVNAGSSVAANGYAILFVGSQLGNDVGHPECGGYNPSGMFVLLPDNVTWQTDETFFAGGTSELWVEADLCCPALDFLSCTPAADPDWETQGNGIGRPNATNASLSSLCGLTQSWTASPGGACNMVQPLIAGDNVLIAGVDSLHCYDKTAGTQNWSFGGFPYIIGDLRGSPTVDDTLVYLGGAGAHSFSCIRLSDGSVKWSRNLGGLDVPLLPGLTAHTPNVVSGGHVYFTQETGNVYKLDALTGADAGGSPLALPDAPNAVPYNALTSNGSKLWVGTANTVGTDGNLHQIDMATMAIDWTLNSPGIIFYPSADSLYDPEGFPGSLAFEDGVLYYHSQIRNDANGFLHFPQTGSLGAIDVALEDGLGAGLLWVNDANVTTLPSPGTNASTVNWSGPAIGPGMVYLGGRGLFASLTEQDGISAWDKTLGVRVWYNGYTKLGVSGGVDVLDDIRSDVPVTVFCQGGIPYLFTSHMLGLWRLVDGNTGELVWSRQFSERVRGTAIGDDCVAVATRVGGVAGALQGQLCVFTVGADRPRLQIDSQFVFRTATPGDGVVNDNILDAIQNTGCINLNVAAYNEVNPPAVRVLGSNPMLASSIERSERKLAGFNALLSASNPSKMRGMAVIAGIEEETDEADIVRTFANNSAKSAADPLFLTVITAPGAIAAGATQTLNVDYDETGLTNNTGYTNFIEIDSDDPDYFPQDPTNAFYDLPFIQFELFIGCPDATADMNLGLGVDWISNYGRLSDGAGLGMHINGNDYHFDGGVCAAVTDNTMWAMEGISVSSGLPSEWGPTLPCGLSVVAANYNSPLGVGADAVEEVTYNSIDLGSVFGYFTPSSRPMGGITIAYKRVGSQDPAFGDFGLTSITITNDADGGGNMVDLYYGNAHDWDIAPFGNNNGNKDLTDHSYSMDNGGAAGRSAATAFAGHLRLDADAVGTIVAQSGGTAGTFQMGDFSGVGCTGCIHIGDPQGYRMLSDPYNYLPTDHPTEANPSNDDLGVYWSAAHIPVLADGESYTFYTAQYAADEATGNTGSWSTGADYDKAVTEIKCRAKAFAGFGKGDINCDGCVDLQDVVALGNIVDGLLTPAGASIYTADTDGDNDWDNADYDLLYDVVSGVQPEAALGNGWRF